MSYIEKERLIKADIASIENRVRHAFNQGYDLGFKEGKKRAKPLEQEPVIDKIRAEIVELTKCPYGTECLGANCPSNTDCMICGDHVLEIIDKYKAGQEQEDDNS